MITENSPDFVVIKTNLHILKLYNVDKIFLHYLCLINFARCKLNIFFKWYILFVIIIILTFFYLFKLSQYVNMKF